MGQSVGPRPGGGGVPRLGVGKGRFGGLEVGVAQGLDLGQQGGGAAVALGAPRETLALRAADGGGDALVALLGDADRGLLAHNRRLGGGDARLQRLGALRQEGDAQKLFDEGALLGGGQLEERVGIGVQSDEIAEQVGAHAHHALDLGLGVAVLALRLVGSGTLRRAGGGRAIRQEPQNVGLAASLDAVASSAALEVERYQHALAVGVVHEVVEAHARERLAVEGVENGLDYGRLPGAIALVGELAVQVLAQHEGEAGDVEAHALCHLPDAEEVAGGHRAEPEGAVVGHRGFQWRTRRRRSRGWWTSPDRGRRGGILSVWSASR